MNDDDFEWHSRKAARNYAEHGITFEVAREVVDDPAVLDVPDDREDYGEDRFNAIGVVKGRLIVVTLHAARQQNSFDLGTACRAT